MIINPIIPIWLMTVISIGTIIFILYNKQLKNIISNKQENGERTARQKSLTKQYAIDSLIKIFIIILLFVINLRIMVPDGESTAINSDLNILFVIDTTVSMRALDYDGNKERFEGVVNDLCYIVDELSNCKFSILTFGDTAQRLIPFTTDTDMVQAELKAITLENDTYAKGSSLNIAKTEIEKLLSDESKREEGNAKSVVFFISDGEITKENEKLESFSGIKKYVSNGAVLGYGTKDGGKMVSSLYADNPLSPSYYVYYYDENNSQVTAISKIDENNLKQVASEMGIDYIHMDKTSNIDYKIKEIKEQSLNAQTAEEKIKTYKDIYYYFAVPLAILLIIHFIIQKRRM